MAATLLLGFLGLPVSLYLMLRLGLSNHGCGAGNIGLLCLAQVQLAIIWLPVVVLLCALGVCVVGGLRRRSTGRAPDRAVLLGWVMFGTATVALALLASW